MLEKAKPGSLRALLGSTISNRSYPGTRGLHHGSNVDWQHVTIEGLASEDTAIASATRCEVSSGRIKS
jgi:hypothetical protein